MSMWEHVLFLLASWAQSRRCLCHRIQTQTTFSENSSFTRNSYERWYLRARGVTLPVLAISRENRLKSRRKTKPPASSPVALFFVSCLTVELPCTLPVLTHSEKKYFVTWTPFDNSAPRPSSHFKISCFLKELSAGKVWFCDSASNHP